MIPAASETGHTCPAPRGSHTGAVPRTWRLSAPMSAAQRQEQEQLRPGHTGCEARQALPGQRAPARSADRAPALCHRCQPRYFQEMKGGPCVRLSALTSTSPSQCDTAVPGAKHGASKHAFCASRFPERAASPPGARPRTGAAERSTAGGTRRGRGKERLPRDSAVRALRDPGRGGGRAARRGRTMLGAGRPPPPACPPWPPPAPRRVGMAAPTPPAFTFFSGTAAAPRLRGPRHTAGNGSGLPGAKGAAPARPAPSPPHRPGEAGHPHWRPAGSPSPGLEGRGPAWLGVPRTARTGGSGVRRGDPLSPARLSVPTL